jgi:arsenite methyltransferase
MTQAIETRYATLAESCCCLSCGTAAGRVDAEPGQVCVDLGSGRGTDVVRMAERVGPTGHAYGIDITDTMLEKARSLAAKLCLVNATFLKGELEHLPLESASADWLTSNCVLNHAADKSKVWSEIARVLKPGGQFVVSDIYACAPVPDDFRNDPDAVAECWAGAVTRAEYLAAIEAAGLRDVRIVEEGTPYEKGHIDVVSFTIRGRAPAKPAAGVG